jgi:hypothetical protein
MSKINTFAEKICDLVRSETDCLYVVIGSQQFSSDKYPSANVIIDNCECDFSKNINKTFDIDAELFISVDGNSYEQVQGIVEDLLTIFLIEPGLQDMISLGAIGLRPTDFFPALNFKEQIGLYRGGVRYTFSYRNSFV